MDDFNTISTKRLKELEHAEAFLQALEACGVDNWCGYSDAQEMMDEEVDS